MLANATAFATLPKSGAFGPYLRVIVSAGTLALAGALDREIGTVKERLLGSGLGSFNSAPVVVPTAQGIVRMIANGAITIYGRVYGGASGKVSGTANGNFIGYAMTATTADGDEVDVLRIAESPCKLFTSVVASTAVQNSVAELIYDQFATIPANSLRVGDVIRFRGKVTASSGNSTDTLTVRARFGPALLTGQLLANTGAFDVTNGGGDTAVIEGEITVRTLGAAGTIIADGHITIGVPGTATFKTFDLASTVVDTTVANQLGLTGQWSVANAGNISASQKVNVTIERQ